ncbi:tetratricopeptide repeat protein [Myxococcota bacterium]|nr:tetratricopeptide repeat protein [Myxococcota bacterium]
MSISPPPPPAARALPPLATASLVVALAGALAGGPARAGAPQCQQCCADAGLYSCPTWLRVMGPGSAVTNDVGGIRVTGIWRLDCETGARFEESATVVVASRPRDGDVLLVGSPLVTVECFRDWCAVPEAACLVPRSGGMALVRCADAQPLTAAELARKGITPAPSYSPARPTPNPGTESLAARPSPAASSTSRMTTVVVVEEIPAAPAPAVSAPAVPSPSLPSVVEPSVVVIEQGGPTYPPHLPAEGPLPVTMAWALPAGPGARCSTADAVAAEATRHLDMGDDARLRGEHQQAADEYRVAVTLDRCSAIAWTALGQLALAADDTEKAVAALEYAVALRPSHYGALTSLGLAYEARGRMAEAADAFGRAIALRPGNPAAEDGLGRVRGAR